uniref:NADH dehydrogenase subunit 4 n=1 Tax=Amritodus flavoscutatus TaxID=2479863 RepID=UPI002E7607ED|nr:NADH dehydrogenase subunit 4 [Amritodus flavoscutatus]WQF70195.1 NADH dehydrogenase subunit 4 [Amritodus flavoscutatus]
MSIIMTMLLFMTPLVMLNLNWNLILYSIMLMMVLFSLMGINTFFSMLSYNFGIDYISYSLILLSFLIISLMLLSSVSLTPLFVILNLILVLVLFIIFSSLNLFIMYLFFEFSLIPLIILILGWGYQPERLLSILYLFFYTLFASLPLLIIIIFLYLNYGSLFVLFNYGMSDSFIIHFFMIFAFLVKLPMFMFHFWLPKAHVQAPISGSMILAGLFLKIGGYGLVRFMFIYELMYINYSYIWYSLSIWGSILVSMVCFMQGDIKCMIAYSSVCHMNMCILGLVTMNYWGLLGSYLMMIGHGLCSSAMFCMANFVYERLSSRSFFITKGLITFMPSLSLTWSLFCFFNMSCPPSINFLSELIIMLSMMSYYYWSFIFMIMISFLSACFSVYLFSYTFQGSFHDGYSYSCLNIKEYLLLLIHLLPIFFIVILMDIFFF